MEPRAGSLQWHGREGEGCELKRRRGNLITAVLLRDALQMAFSGLNSSFKNQEAELEGCFFFFFP